MVKAAATFPEKCDLDIVDLQAWTAGKAGGVVATRRDRFGNAVPKRSGESRLTGSGKGPGNVEVSTLTRSGPATSTGASCVRLVRHENIPARPASDWSVMKIYPRVLRPIGPS